MVLIFGASRFTGIGKALGDGIREFKKASSGSSSEKKDEEAIFKAAKKLGIDTEGKTKNQLVNEIEKVNKPSET